jgi:hypothetical protein
VPPKPAVINGPGTGQCGAIAVAYSIPAVAGASSYLWTVNGGATIVGPNNLTTVIVNFPASFNNITLSVSAVNTCGSGMARTLSVKGKVSTPSSISGNISVCNGATETYIANGAPGATSYIWTKPAGATIIGPSNGSSINIMWGSTGGNVTAKALNSCSTSGKSTLSVAVSCRIGNDGIPNSLNPIVFPNPANASISLSYTGSNAEILTVELYDLQGRILMKEALVSSEGKNIHEFDLRSISKGVYMMRLTGKNSNEVIKVIVEH